MDFEQQLEKAEKLPEPSLVGASLRSADDSPHNNYIHPEKYKKPSKSVKGKKKKSVTASLDDLINEGALLGSEEDFEKFLDDEGHVKDDAKYEESSDAKSTTKSPIAESFGDLSKNKSGVSPEKETAPENLRNRDNTSNSPIKLGGEESLDSVLTPSLESKPADKPSLDPRPLESKNASEFYNQNDYSTPNLSEYQLEHQINDHSDLLSSIKSYDPHVLPKFESNDSFRKEDAPEKPKSSTSKPKIAQPELVPADSIHTPYFHTDRSRSRSRSANRLGNPTSERSRSRSAIKPHLARGDSYKNTNVDEPDHYELPPDLAAATNEEEEEDDGDDRRTRFSKPTMGESIAKAEAAAEDASINEHFRRDPSLVTTGDYTNFNVDTPTNEFKPSDRLYSTRSESSTNYLRSISRSRSNARPNIDASHDNEKNDADPTELVREGALVTDDPYSTIEHLDTMVEEISKPTEKATEKKNVNFEDHVIEEEKKDEKEEAKPKANSEDKLDSLKVSKEDGLAEDKSAGDGPVLTAKDIKVDEKDLPYEEKVGHEPEITRVNEQDVRNLAADKIKDEEHEPAGPSLNADDIKHEEKEEETKDSLDTAVSKLAISDNTIESKEDNEEAPKKEQTEEVSKDLGSESKVDLKAQAEEPELKKDLKESEPVAEPEVSEGTEVVKEVTEDTQKDLREEPEEPKVAAEETEEPKESIAETPEVPLKEEAKEVTNAITENSTSDVKEDNEKDIEESEEPKEKSLDESKETGVVSAAIISASAAVAGIAGALGSTKDEKEEDIKEEDTKKEGTENKDVGHDDDMGDIEVSAAEIRKHNESLPIYVYTSLAGGMQIVPRTNRLVTILQANGIKFEYRDLGTDEEAKKLWRRQANGKPLPGVVRGDDFIGNFKDIDDANEEYQLHELLYDTL